MITGGALDSGDTASVLRFDSNDLNSNPIEVESMVYPRSSHACTIFRSLAHEGRQVVIVAGGYGGPDKAEIWNFSQEGTSWQESKLILILYYFPFFTGSMNASYFS